MNKKKFYSFFWGAVSLIGFILPYFVLGKFIGRVISVVIILIWIVAAIVFHFKSVSNLKSKAGKLKEKNKKLKENNQGLKQQIKKDNTEIKSYQSEIAISQDENIKIT